MGYLIVTCIITTTFATVQLRHSTGTAFKAEEDVPFYSETVDATISTFFAAPRQVLHDLGYANAVLCRHPVPISLSERQFLKLDKRLSDFFELNLVTTKNLRAENISDLNKYEMSVERIKSYQKSVCETQNKADIAAKKIGSYFDQARLEKDLSDSEKYHSVKKNKDWSFSNLITDLFVGIGGIPGFFGAASIQHEQDFQRNQVRDFPFFLKCFRRLFLNHFSS